MSSCSTTTRLTGDASAAGFTVNGPSPEQVIFTVPPDAGPFLGPTPNNTFNYAFVGGEVDALANKWDAYFSDVMAFLVPPKLDNADLLVSFARDPNALMDKAVYYETQVVGGTGVHWTDLDLSDPPVRSIP